MFNNRENKITAETKPQKRFTAKVLLSQHKRRVSDNGWRAGLVLPKDSFYYTNFLSKQFQIGLDSHH